MRSRERLEALAAGVKVSSANDNSDLVGDAAPRATREQNDRDVKDRAPRVRGVFNGMNKRMDVLTEIPGYVMRWFNDTPGRIDRARTGYWEFVRQSEVSLSESNKVLERNSDVGDKIRAIVGVTDQNEPLYAYLMKLKKEWFDEDQQDAATAIRKSEAEMLRNGGLNTDRIAEKYLPDQRKQALVMRQGEFRRNVN